MSFTSMRVSIANPPLAVVHLNAIELIPEVSTVTVALLTIDTSVKVDTGSIEAVANSSNEHLAVFGDSYVVIYVEGTSGKVASGFIADSCAIMQEAGLDGETKLAKSLGGISTVHTGQTIGAKQFLQFDGTIGETKQFGLLGSAKSATDLLVHPDAVDKTLNPDPSFVRSGSYIPVITGLTNLSVGTSTATFMQIGNIVTVYFDITDFDPVTTAITTTFSVSLPIASAFTDSEDLSGHAAYRNRNSPPFGAVASVDVAAFAGMPIATSLSSCQGSFSYIVK